jgi:hypothetical protein
LLVNKPLRKADGSAEYTVTNPFSIEGVQQGWEGSELNSTYIEEIRADNSRFTLEFRVPFYESGSFFVQLRYTCDQDPSAKRYCKPNFINVEPTLYRGLSCKEISLMTVMSRQLGPLSRWP